MGTKESYIMNESKHNGLRATRSTPRERGGGGWTFDLIGEYIYHVALLVHTCTMSHDTCTWTKYIM